MDQTSQNYIQRENKNPPNHLINDILISSLNFQSFTKSFYFTPYFKKLTKKLCSPPLLPPTFNSKPSKISVVEYSNETNLQISNATIEYLSTSKRLLCFPLVLFISLMITNSQFVQQFQICFCLFYQYYHRRNIVYIIPLCYHFNFSLFPRY